ncbi:sulfide:quinone oxidoreductase, mitochondrial isoform X2 [Belonocnema kinseyi]|uniref:sulfide:quinone oxidoreductase, mitochondrial isoform X2 n=1 Tax=Belonocnema kinseyi TaxID=2817044 RepID=UPI00143DC281|nr:sulfide:quinone oxidoreductase, mitochondrial isoform X2 [Belonocnema kinseyi]
MYGIVRSSSRILKFQNVRYASHSCKILVLGGGCGGCTIAAKFSKKYKDQPNHVIIVEPCEDHYYQPIFTLIGAGVGKLESARKKMKDVLPKDAQWLKDSVVGFDPENCKVTTKNHTIQYEILIVALGLQTNWNAIPGLAEGLENPDAQVCSIYGPNTVSKVFEKIKRTKNGSALFTFPNSPIKCPGAPQKIAYLAEDYWRKQKRRYAINVVYNTTLPVIFGVKKYADSLWEVCKRRNINVNLQTNLVEIKPDKKEAVFQNLKNPEKKWTTEYSLLHVSPPMSAPDVLKSNSLTNEAGFLSVSPKTLQHTKYSNIYGLGDCTSSPNSKTMAAIVESCLQKYYGYIGGKRDGSLLRWLRILSFGYCIWKMHSR